MWIRAALLGLAFLSVPTSLAVASCNCEQYCFPFISQTAELSWQATQVNGESVAEPAPSLQLIANVDGTVTAVFEGNRDGGYEFMRVDAQ